MQLINEIPILINENIPENQFLICRRDEDGNLKASVWDLEMEDITPEFAVVLNKDFWELI